MTKDEWNKVKATPPARSKSPARRKGKGKGKNVDKSRCCPEYLESGSCTMMDQGEKCAKLHIRKEDLVGTSFGAGKGKKGLAPG